MLNKNIFLKNFPIAKFFDTPPMLRIYRGKSDFWVLENLLSKNGKFFSEKSKEF